MKLNYIKATAGGLWVLALGAAVLLADISSPPSWIAFVGWAIVPPLILTRYWNHPAQTMSESIQRVLR